jgi:hypothetical protein
LFGWSYCGGGGGKCTQWFTVVFLSLSSQVLGQYFKISHDCFMYFQIHHSLSSYHSVYVSYTVGNSSNNPRISIMFWIWLPMLWLFIGLQAGWSGVWVPAGAGNFSVHYCVQASSGVHQASYPVGIRGSSPGSKAVRHEADHPPPSSAKVKIVWSCTFAPQYAFMAWLPVKKSTETTWLFIPMQFLHSSEI